MIENSWGVRYIRIDDVLKIIEKVGEPHEEVKHFFEMEIEQTRDWLKSEVYSFFNGVDVGHEQAIELMKKAYNFLRTCFGNVGKINIGLEERDFPGK